MSFFLFVGILAMVFIASFSGTVLINAWCTEKEKQAKDLCMGLGLLIFAHGMLTMLVVSMVMVHFK